MAGYTATALAPPSVLCAMTACSLTGTAVFGSVASRSRFSLSPAAIPVGLDRTAQVSAALASEVPVTAALVARMAPTAAADRVGSGRPTRTGSAVFRLARMSATSALPSAARRAAVAVGSASTSGLVAIDGPVAGAAIPLDSAVAIHMLESGIQMAAARSPSAKSAGSVGCTSIGQPSAEAEPASSVTTSAMSGATAMVTAPSADEQSLFAAEPVLVVDPAARPASAAA